MPTISRLRNRGDRTRNCILQTMKLLAAFCALAMLTPVMADDDASAMTEQRIYKSEIKLQNVMDTKSARSLAEAVTSRYPDFRLEQVCAGALTESGAKDIVLSLVNEQDQTAAYVVSPGNNPAEFIEMVRFPNTNTTTGGWGISTPLKCTTEAKYFEELQQELGQDYKKYLSGHRLPINKLDLVCIISEKLPNRQQYYQFNRTSKEFVEIDPPYSEAATNEKNVQETAAALKKEFGASEAQAVIKAVSVKYPGFNIEAACHGAISKPGVKDVVLGIANHETRSNIYLAGFGKSHTDFVEIVRHPNQNFDGLILECSTREKYIANVKNSFKTAYTKKEYQEWLRENGKFPGENIPGLNVACTAIDNEPVGIECYQYDGKTKKFIDIGGWTND